MASFKRISKAAARKLFNEGKGVYLCPHKMRPDTPFSEAILVFSKEWLDRAEMYRDNPKLWCGTLEKTAWNLMYNNWSFYNSSYETGYYAAYYVEV